MLLASLAAALLVAGTAHAGGQGMFVDVDLAAPSALLSIDDVHCLGVPPVATLQQHQYVEASGSLACLASRSGFEMSLWSAARRVAGYRVTVSAWGSRVDATYVDPAYAVAQTLYPHSRWLGTQDWLRVSAAGLDPAGWMLGVDPRLRVNQLVLPGSHDSGSSSITAESPVTEDAAPGIAEAARYVPGTVAAWARTQAVDVGRQLASGLRYLDLRLCGGPELRDIHTCHGMRGQSLVELIEQVDAFADRHPSELLLLDFNHWYAADGSDPASMRAHVYRYLRQRLGPRLAERARFGPTSTLGELRAAQRMVIVSTDDAAGGEDLFWRSVNTASLGRCGAGIDLCSYWPASAHADELAERLRQALDALRATPHDFLFVVQAQLTPDLRSIVSSRVAGADTGLLGYTGGYKYDVSRFLDTPGRFDGLSGLVLIEDFSNGIDLVQLALRLTGR